MKTTATFLSASYLSFFLALALLTSCGSSGNQTEQMLTKKWQYDKVNVNGQEMSGKQIGNPTMQFNEDKTYQMDFGGMSEQGEWKLNGDSLTTISKKNDQQQTLFIKELKKDKMIVEGKAQQGKMIITLVPSTGKKDEQEGQEQESATDAGDENSGY